MQKRSVTTSFGYADDLFTLAAEYTELPERTIACGVYLHPKTSLYQTWCSLYGTDLTWLSSYDDKGKAGERVVEEILDNMEQKFVQAGPDPKPLDEEKVEDLLETSVALGNRDEVITLKPYQAMRYELDEHHTLFLLRL